jgi:uncharacterized protein DUF397
MIMDRSVNWQKSSFSSTEPENSCLEVAAYHDGAAFRESDDATVVLSTSRARLKALLNAVQLDSFEVIRPGLGG